MIEWLALNWLRGVVVPLLAFLATYIIGVWSSSLAERAFLMWTRGAGLLVSRKVASTIRGAFITWFALLGAFIAFQISLLAIDIKSLTGRIIASLFVLSLTWVIILATEQLFRAYMLKLKVSVSITRIMVNVIRITVAVIGVLVVLDIWGLSTSPIILLIGIAVLVAAIFFRDAAPNFFAGMQLTSGQQLKVGDYIKLESGDEGYVTALSLSTTHLTTLDEKAISIPNSRLIENTVINYGRSPKKAKDPFRFNSWTDLAELTGLKARNLRELTDTLRKVPESVIFFHTHRFIEEYYSLRPEPSNDFAVWVSDALGDEVLGERLASVDTFAFPSLGALRERFITILEEYLSTSSSLREAMPGREFYFMKSVSFILPTPYVAHDLRELAEVLRKMSRGALYYHVFEARLRLGRGKNDFSIWLQDSLGESELAEDINRVDPYTYTLEGLRLALLQRIEKQLK